MTRPRTKALLIGALIVTALGGWLLWYEYNKLCCAFPDEPEPEWVTARDRQSELGLMTSLPLYWPLDATMEDVAAGTAQLPWQRQAMERQFALRPLDTVSPIAGLSDQDPDTDPLEGLAQLAVIQPRGLSPSDNVALDNWVRAGGKLLLVLDPLLTGEYDLPLGDPRRPVDAALIPPVVARWGLTISFDPDQPAAIEPVAFPGGVLQRSISGAIAVEGDGDAQCELYAQSMLAQCLIGDGKVTVLADAASFEIPPQDPTEVGGQLPPQLVNLLNFAFD